MNEDKIVYLLFEDSGENSNEILLKGVVDSMTQALDWVSKMSIDKDRIIKMLKLNKIEDN